MAAPPARARADYDYLIKLLLIGDSGEFIGHLNLSISSLSLSLSLSLVCCVIWSLNWDLVPNSISVDVTAKCEWVDESKVSNHLRAFGLSIV
jgi:hypothetical protein